MDLLKDKTVLIIGLGLIGGSVARGLAAGKLCKRIVAYGREESVLQSAMIDGSIQGYSTDLSVVAPEADLILIAVPTLTVRPVLEALASMVGEHTIITDAASVKGNVVADARRIFASTLHRFVPGHPIAGSEQSGYHASRGDLYEQRKVILTPLPDNDPVAVRTVMQLWQGLGAEVHAMSPDRHDTVLAGTSHLPHLLAYALVNTLVDRISEPDRIRQVFDYAAGGFADFSRIASSDPVMWRDIFLANTNATVDVLDAYIQTLQQMRQQLLRAEGAVLHNDFARAKRVRDDFIKRFREGSQQSSVSADWQAVVLARPGLSLRGEYRAPATVSLACEVLHLPARDNALSTYTGFPEDTRTLAAVQALRDSGVLVVGPEKGKVLIYGATALQEDLNAPPDRLSPAVRPGDGDLPADEFLSGLVMVAASVITSSSVLIRSVDFTGMPFVNQEDGTAGEVWHPTQTQAGVLPLLCDMGVSFQVVRTSAGPWLTGDMLVAAAISFDGRVFDLSGSSHSDDQLLLMVVAGLLAKGETRLVLPVQQTPMILERTRPWQDLGADMTVTESGDLLVRQSPLMAGIVPCGGDVALSVASLVIAQRATGQLTISEPGDIPGRYPGLLQTLTDLGFGLSLEDAAQS